MKNDARNTALAILVRIEKTNRTLDWCIERFEDRLSALDPRDRNLCNALVYGTLRHRGAIDWIIAGCSDRKLDRMDPFARNAVRMALFQIIYMDKIPMSAAVNTAVDMARDNAGPKTGGFVNAVLRAACRTYQSPSFPSQEQDQALFLSVTRSMPLWLVQRWINRYSFQRAKSLCDSINEIPWITVRTNTLKTTRNDLWAALSPLVNHIRPAGFSDTGLHCTGPKQPIHTMEPFIDGWFQIQDEAAQLVSCMLAPKPGHRVLDACAGLGGKTGHIADLMQNQGQILALDTDESRLSMLIDAMSRMGVDIVKTVAADLMTSSINTLDGYFDRILLDAPCSGLGVIKRHPDARWNRREKDIFRMGTLQKKMLSHASNMVKPGGYLLYTVCSCEPEETEKVIIPFINKRTDFTISHDFVEQACTRINPFISETGFFCTYPEPGGMDGFFAALLKRKPRK